LEIRGEGRAQAEGPFGRSETKHPFRPASESAPVGRPSRTAFLTAVLVKVKQVFQLESVHPTFYPKKFGSDYLINCVAHTKKKNLILWFVFRLLFSLLEFSHPELSYFRSLFYCVICYEKDKAEQPVIVPHIAVQHVPHDYSALFEEIGDKI
jgi:hypothetical protein